MSKDRVKDELVKIFKTSPTLRGSASFYYYSSVSSGQKMTALIG